MMTLTVGVCLAFAAGALWAGGSILLSLEIVRLDKTLPDENRDWPTCTPDPIAPPLPTP